MTNFGQKVIDFHENLTIHEPLPKDIQLLNPFSERGESQENFKRFYQKFFNDKHKRKMILGINPGRFGAGLTGIPFTDTKRSAAECGLPPLSFESHEPSSVFVYEVIKAYGGVKKFYSLFYINSVCPLGFIKKNNKGNWVNCNYYDFPDLYQASKNFIVDSLKKQIQFGIHTDTCYSLGIKNAKFLKEINKEYGFFRQIIGLPHPRYIVQYRYKQKEKYVHDYITQLSESITPQ